MVRQQNRIETLKIIGELNPIRFARGQSPHQNIMDYTLDPTIGNKVSFYAWQWEVMKRDIGQYYPLSK